jgi:hypothetical protein
MPCYKNFLCMCATYEYKRLELVVR